MEKIRNGLAIEGRGLENGRKTGRLQYLLYKKAPAVQVMILQGIRKEQAFTVHEIGLDLVCGNALALTESGFS